MTWTRLDAEHLLRRTGFGTTAAEVDAALARSRDECIAQLVEYESVQDPVWLDPNPLALPQPDRDWGDARANLVFRLLSSRRPLEARLIWMWHGHFTTSMAMVGIPLFMRQIETWRTQATRRFDAFLLAMYKDGAMLRYLNGAGSRKEMPNENFAREVMELYTTGTGPYTETDVRESARALTGWDVSWTDNSVAFSPDRHDAGAKTILGVTEHFNGEALMELLAARPETARRTCRKLYRSFVGERLNLSQVELLVRTWRVTGGDVKSVMRALLQSTAFWASSNRLTLLKSPLDFAAGLLKQFNVTLDGRRGRELAWFMGEMGVPPFDPPNPAGYRSAERLCGASMLLTRYQLAYHVLYTWTPDESLERVVDGQSVPLEGANLLQILGTHMGVTPTTNTRTAVAEYLGSAPIERSAVRERVRDVAYLLACSPEYQMY